MATEDMCANEESGKEVEKSPQFCKNSSNSVLSTNVEFDDFVHQTENPSDTRRAHEYRVRKAASADNSAPLQHAQRKLLLNETRTADNGHGIFGAHGGKLSAVPRIYNGSQDSDIALSLATSLGLLSLVGPEPRSSPMPLHDVGNSYESFTWTSTMRDGLDITQSPVYERDRDNNSKRPSECLKSTSNVTSMPIRWMEHYTSKTSSAMKGKLKTEEQPKKCTISKGGKQLKREGNTENHEKLDKEEFRVHYKVPDSVGNPSKMYDSQIKRGNMTALNVGSDGERVESEHPALELNSDLEQVSLSLLQDFNIFDDTSALECFNSEFCLKCVGTSPTQNYDQSSLPVVPDFINEDLYSSFQDGGVGDISQCAGDSSISGASPNTTFSLRQASQRGGSRKVQKRQANDENDDEENDEDPNQPKKPRLHTGVSDNIAKSMKLACPYNKRDPQKYSQGACVNGNLRGISKVKEHLYRSHLELPCYRCNSTFKSEEDLKSHARHGCELTPEEHDYSLSGISPAILKELKSKKKYGRKPSVEELWFDIYRLLFPGCSVPSHPYPEACTPTKGWMQYHTFAKQSLLAFVEIDFDEAFAGLLPDPEYRSVLKTTILSLICEKQRQVAAVYEAQEYSRARSNSEGGSDNAIGQRDTSGYNVVSRPSPSSAEAQASDPLPLHWNPSMSMEYAPNEISAHARHRLSSSSDNNSSYNREPVTPRHATSEEMDSAYGSAAPCGNSECHGCHKCTGFKHFSAPSRSQQQIIPAIGPLNYDQPPNASTSGTTDQAAALFYSTGAFTPSQLDNQGGFFDFGDYLEGQ